MPDQVRHDECPASITTGPTPVADDAVIASEAKQSSLRLPETPLPDCFVAALLAKRTRLCPAERNRHPGLDPGSTFFSIPVEEEGGCRIKSGMTNASLPSQ
ncbi:MAG TPA: hypothetical protein VK403_08610 [Allosphingosinicella sp.]|nr:hypothetical protein [Allosphingosinicella sp.]